MSQVCQTWPEGSLYVGYSELQSHLLKDDWILALNGQKVSRLWDIAAIISVLPPGEARTVENRRNTAPQGAAPHWAILKVSVPDPRVDTHG